MQSLHKLNYCPPLQKSGFAPQSKSFRTTLELERCFASIGIQVKAIQITPGELSGSFDIYGSSSLPILSLQTNQGLVVEGDRNPHKTIVGLEQTDNIELHRVEVPRQLHDPVQPVAEGCPRLVSVQRQAVAEDEL